MPLPALVYHPPGFAQFPELVAAQSTRHGGVSPAPFASLNLGLKSGDDPERVRQNRQRYAQALGIDLAQVVFAQQVHGPEVGHVTQAGPLATDCDALITDCPNLFLGIFVADCTPVLVYDARTRAVGAAHAGWRGTVGGVVRNLLAAMAAHFGSRPADCHAHVGTCIGPTAFEVGDEVADQFAPVFKHRHPQTGKFMVDLKAANRQQLLDFGIPPAQIEVSPHCTVVDNAHYFSYRKEGPASGRMVALIGVRRK
jgi:polyphenol oxidase